MIVTRDEALRILAPYLETIRRCVRTGVDHYLTQVPPEARAWYSARTRASIIHDAIVQSAYHEFSAIPGVQLENRRGYLEVIIDGRLRLRWKKLNAGLRPRNIPTQQTYEFMHQLQFDFPDAPPSLTNIIAGYRWNTTQTDILGVYIVCPNGATNAWHIDVDAELLPQTIQETEDRVTHIRPRTRRRVVPKDRPAHDESAGDRHEA